MNTAPRAIWIVFPGVRWRYPSTNNGFAVIPAFCAFLFPFVVHSRVDRHVLSFQRVIRKRRLFFTPPRECAFIGCPRSPYTCTRAFSVRAACCLSCHVRRPTSICMDSFSGDHSLPPPPHPNRCRPLETLSLGVLMPLSLSGLPHTVALPWSVHRFSNAPSEISDVVHK